MNGTTYEDNVVAYLSLCMLCNKQPFGPTFGTIVRIELQMRANGWLFDDVVLTMDSGTEEYKIGFSIKSNQHINNNGIDSELNQLLWQQYLEKEDNPFNSNKDYCGLIQPPLARKLGEDLDAVIQQARLQDAAVFYQKNTKHKANSVQKRSIYLSFQCPDSLFVLSGLKKEESVLMLSKFVFFSLDLNAAQSTSAERALDFCGELLENPTIEEKTKLYAFLRSIPRDFAPFGGYLDSIKLIGLLLPVFRLKDFPVFKKDWDKVRERTALSIGILQDTIGGKINFSRTNQLELIQKNFINNHICILSGSSGAGKTIAAKKFVQTVASSANVIWLEAVDFELPNLSNGLGLEHSLEELIEKGTTRPSYLIIDGPEKLTNPQQQDRLARLLRFILALGDSSWKILFTIPSDSVSEVYLFLSRRNISVTSDALVMVENLGERENIALIEAFPELARLMLDEKFRKIVSNLKLLDKLSYHISQLSHDEDTFSETVIIDLIWREEIEKMGVKHPSFMIALASIQADSLNLTIDTSRFTTSDLDPVDDLVTRGFLRFRDGKISFVHDLYGDWARYRHFRSSSDKFKSFTEEKKVSTIMWDRAIQLYALFLLARESGSNAWQKQFMGLSSSETKSIIIQDVFLTGLFIGSNSDQSLETHKELLFKKEGEYLKRLIELFLIKATTVNPEVLRSCREVGIAEQKAIDIDRLPIFHYWPPVLDFILGNLEVVAGLDEIGLSKMVFIWLKHAPSFLLRDRAVKIAIHIVAKIASKRNTYPGGEVKDANQKAIKAMLFGFAEARAEVKELSLKLACREKEKLENYIPNDHRTKPWPDGPTSRINEEFRKVCMEADTLTPMYLLEPGLAGELLLACIIDEPNDIPPFYHRPEDGNLFIVNDFDYNTPFFLRGPFTNFLKFSPHEAIGFICKLTDFCTDRYIEKNYHKDDGPIGLSVGIGEHSKFFFGDYRVFGWNKDMGTAGTPDMLISILMSLENFLYDKLEEAVDISPYLEYMLEKTKSLAILGLVFVVGKSKPVLFDAILHDLLINLDLVYYDRMYNSKYDAWSYIGFPKSWYPQKEKWDKRSQRFTPITAILHPKFILDSTYRENFERVIKAWKLRAESAPSDKNLGQYANDLLYYFDLENYNLEWRNDEVISYSQKPLPVPSTKKTRKKKTESANLFVEEYQQMQAIKDGELLNLDESKKYFESLTTLVRIWEQSGPYKPDKYSIHSPYTHITAVAARLIFSSKIWEDEHFGYWEYIANTTLAILKHRFINLEKSHEFGTGLNWHSFLCIMAPGLYFHDTQSRLGREIIAMCLLLFNLDSTQKVFQYAGMLRNWSDPEFLQLQNLLLRYCFQSKPYKPDLSEDFKNLIEDFIDNRIAGLPMDWEKLKQHEVRLAKGRGRREDKENSPDYSRLAPANNDYILAFFKALPITLDSLSPEDTQLIEGYWLKGIAYMIYQMGPIVPGGKKLDDFPDELSRYMLMNLWTVVFSIEEESRQDVFWQPILQYGYIGVKQIELLMRCFYLKNIDRPAEHGMMVQLLHRMVIFTKDLETWKIASVDRQSDFRLCLYGLDPDTVGIWEDDFSDFTARCQDLYSIYLTKSSLNPYVMLGLLKFLPTPSGIFMLFKGLYTLNLFFGMALKMKENAPEGRIYVGHPKHDKKLEDCLNTLWHKYRANLIDEDSLVLFRLLVEYLVSIRSTVGIELQKAMISVL